ncbi:hypothetical protein A8C56_23560 [Niabella ginsenosidivorans]|uniref:LuxR family transcriptional regulator n=1 Tax=Niabella ginsenosidivorans TaxID=1176587 RepID=A0A1A9IC80_9BACT|nr:hypothetical protein A8C56_23560 [Niabella ginsenosidivorans]
MEEQHSKDNSIYPEIVAQEIEAIQNHAASNDVGLFELQTANDAIKEAASMPDPVYLFDCLIQEGEMVICFADTGLGKTVLCMQAAIHIAQQGYKVLFLDLELSKKQFQKRYTSDNGAAYKMPETLYRIGYSRMRRAPKDISYTGFFLQSLSALIDCTGAQVVFIDNLTKLAAGDTDTAKATIPILEGLNDLKAERGITIVAIEHNKKVDTTRPIQLNDLQGSKMKANLVDSVFTIGRSATDKYLRYVKQVKVRDGELRYDLENVALYQLVKDDYLRFELIGYGNEFEHLKNLTEKDTTARKEEARVLREQGVSNREIGRRMGVSEGAVRKWFKT